MPTSCPLQLHGREIASVFELLGYRENDITASLGWALSRSPLFRAGLIGDVFPEAQHSAATSIVLQEAAESGGYTDVEIQGEHIHCIVEAKRGWNLPNCEQLGKYAARFTTGPGQAAILVISECSPDYAARNLPQAVSGVRVHYRSWRQIDALSSRVATRRSLHERQLLAELRAYLRRAMTMQDQESNLVYVVSLASDTPEWSSISWRDIVNKKRRYFHPPAKKGWPLEPPNYLGFRYDRKLQSIHHVERYEIVDRLHMRIPEISPDYKGRHAIYMLGEPIVPRHDVLTGKIYPSGRVWAMIDLLLTCSTVSEARDLTKQRLARLGSGSTSGVALQTGVQESAAYQTISP